MATALLEAIDDDMLAASLDDARPDRNASAAILVIAHSVQVGQATADELRDLVVPARFGRTSTVGTAPQGEETLRVETGSEEPESHESILHPTGNRRSGTATVLPGKPSSLVHRQHGLSMAE